jgi:cyclophilin family peptidyl-prolyl cis-trans isomerase
MQFLRALAFFLVGYFLFAFTPAEKFHTVNIQTKYGIIIVKLYNETPEYRDNFLKLVHHHFFDSLLFHRVIPNFMIQGGDPTSKRALPGTLLGDSDSGYTLPADFHPDLFHKRGALASARDDNPGKRGSGSQFYIVEGKIYNDSLIAVAEKRSGHIIPDDQKKIYETIGGAAHLDQNYTVFGEVISGMNFVDSIAHVKRDSNDRPLVDERMFMKEGKKVK